MSRISALVRAAPVIEVFPGVVPRIEAIMKTFGEIAHNQGAPRHHIEILLKGLDYGVFRRSTIETRREDRTTPYTVDKSLDWETHRRQVATQHRGGIEVNGPYDLTSVQIDRRFEDLLVYLYQLKGLYGVTETGLRFEYVSEIGTDPQKYASWNQRLGLVTAPPINWTPGVRREHQFQPPGLRECTFTVSTVKIT